MWALFEDDYGDNVLIQLDGGNRIKVSEEDDGSGPRWEIHLIRDGFVEVLVSYNKYEYSKDGKDIDGEAKAKEKFIDLAKHLGAYSFLDEDDK